MAINTFNLKPELVEYLESKGFSDFTEVQNKVIPALLKDKQVFVESPTGTGKTLSFLLPNISNIDIDNMEVQYIVFVPTRELGKQISNVIKEIRAFVPGLKHVDILGGEDSKRQAESLSKGQHIVVATPNRLERVINENKVNLQNVKYITIDEVDMILGFDLMQPITTMVEERFPINIHWSMFSATFSLPLQNWVKKYVKGNVSNIVIKGKEEDKTILTLKFDDGHRDDKLLQLVDSDFFNPFLSIIFCKTNDEVKHVHNMLKDHGLKKIGMLHRDMNQREINKVVKQIDSMDLVYLIATDKVARGMDFPGVSHVVNYSLPADLNYFKHRIGRTDRVGGAQGDVYIIFGDEDKQKLDLLQKKNNIRYEKKRL